MGPSPILPSLILDILYININLLRLFLLLLNVQNENGHLIILFFFNVYSIIFYVICTLNHTFECA